MARRPKQTYRCESLGTLTRQLLRFAPTNKRIEQIERAERLHDEIEPDATYPYEYIAYRITGYRGRSEDDATLLVGEAVQPDLRLLIDTLSRSAPLPLNDDGEQFETVEALAQRLNVSTRTIARWRATGLRWRWMQVTGEAPRLVLPGDAVARFLARHSEKVSRASRFTQLTPAERKRLLERARRIAHRRGATLHQVAVHLARKTGRAVETMRQLLEQHDRRRPGQAIFVDRTGPLTTRQHRLCARAHRMGVSVDRIAKKLGRSPSTVYRAINQRRAAELRRRAIAFVAWPIFEREDADSLIPPVAPALLAGGRPRRSKRAVRVDDLPELIRDRYLGPSLTATEQQLLFQRFNYVKYKAAQRRETLDRHEPRAGELDVIESWLAEADAIRDRLVTAYQPVVLSIARRHLVSAADRSRDHLVELLEQGETLLAEAVEAYGQTRSDFEAYLTFRLMKGFVAWSSARAGGRR